MGGVAIRVQVGATDPSVVVVDKIIPCRGPHDLLRAAPNSRQEDRGRLVEDTPGAGPAEGTFSADTLSPQAFFIFHRFRSAGPIDKDDTGEEYQRAFGGLAHRTRVAPS